MLAQIRQTTIKYLAAKKMNCVIMSRLTRVIYFTDVKHVQTAESHRLDLTSANGTERKQTLGRQMLNDSLIQPLGP